MSERTRERVTQCIRVVCYKTDLFLAFRQQMPCISSFSVDLIPFVLALEESGVEAPTSLKVAHDGSHSRRRKLKLFLVRLQIKRGFARGASTRGGPIFR